jgi:predicted Rossmann fold nucleotide-binding protein DprA/Smf involved in DNA uptake
MGEEERRISEMLGDDPMHVDDIVRATGLGIEKVLGLLTKMELTGLIEQLPGKLFVRA